MDERNLRRRYARAFRRVEPGLVQLYSEAAELSVRLPASRERPQRHRGCCVQESRRGTGTGGEVKPAERGDSRFVR